MAAAQVDWQRLFTIAPPDLTAYVGYQISENGLVSQCPAQLLRKARDARRRTAARWLRLRFELRNLVREFTRHKLEFAFLKGVVLAFAAYPDSSLRPVTDIDLLVRRENLTKALELIDDAGYECPERYEFANPFILKDFVVPGEEIALPLEKPGTQALIEVHTQLDSAEPWFPVPIAKIWEHIEKTDWNDLCVPTLDVHEFLFHLVLHLSRGHFFNLGLRALLDVHLWVELQEKRLDWEWIARECIRREYSDWMYLVLKIVNDSFATAIPREFFDHLARPAKLERLENLALEQVWADYHSQAMVPPRLAITLSQPSVGGVISSLFSRINPRRSFDCPTIPVLKASKSSQWLQNSRRILRDLKVKIPFYLRSWRNGGLTWSRLQEAARLMRERREIIDLLTHRQEQEEHTMTDGPDASPRLRGG